MDLKAMSIRQLKELIKKAGKLAKDLEAEQPSIVLAIENGVEDVSYDTSTNGCIASYTGEAIITMENGSIWRAVGKRASGNGWYAYDGYIEFFKIS